MLVHKMLQDIRVSVLSSKVNEMTYSKVAVEQKVSGSQNRIEMVHIGALWRSVGGFLWSVHDGKPQGM